MRGTLVLSPHSDDAALSIGCMLSTSQFVPPITIATVFSISDFAPLAHIQTLKEASELRSREDIEFARSTGCELIELGFQDAIIRLSRPSIDALFDENQPPSNELTASIALSIYKLISHLKPSVLLCPIGIGNHIDHRIVFKAVEEAEECLQQDIMYYEDQPYSALNAHVQQSFGKVGKWQLHTELEITASDRLRQRKLAHAAYYSSQPAAARTVDIMNDQSAKFYERLWLCKEK